MSFFVSNLCEFQTDTSNVKNKNFLYHLMVFLVDTTCDHNLTFISCELTRILYGRLRILYDVITIYVSIERVKNSVSALKSLINNEHCDPRVFEFVIFVTRRNMAYSRDSICVERAR